ncbi:MAG: 2-C-methyl-D-erythritol 4-phosphate cytidylyltransferase, partial [bacterium]|nr:2-C-methyl-D-erythritol 4-phosphate cytidylyltransferase [bacterium]MDW8163646.1 2-C-methyl-D-erythritol 4-phosphate cytidylyltransferase [Candidatus Omnitrophota bacterium]
MIYTILAGAGKGKRLNSFIPKAFVELKHKKLFLYSIEKFYKFSDKIFVAFPPKYVEKYEKILKGFSKV